MSLTLTILKRGHLIGGLDVRVVSALFDSSYPTGGEPVSASEMGLSQVLGVSDLNAGTNDGGYRFKYDEVNGKLMVFRAPGFTPAGSVSAPTFTGTANVGTAGIVNDDDAAATKGHPLYVVRSSGVQASTPVAEGSATGLIKDSDTAAADGVQIYVVIDDPEYLPGFQLAHLEFVSPTNAHGTCTVFNGGPTLLIEDDDAAAANGVAVRAIAAGGGLEATLPSTGLTALVPLSDGQFLHIADSTTGSTPEIYFDEDAVNTYERLQAVVVDNADEPYKLAEASPTVARPLAFASDRVASFVTTAPGDSVSQGTVGSAGGGPEYDVVHDQAAAQLVGAAPLFAQAAGAGLNAALPGGEDVYVPTANGEFIKIAYAASPLGVQVYWDHDAANNWERMLAVVVDNADETYSTEANIGWKRDTPAGTVGAPTLSGTPVAAAAFTEVANGVNLSTVTARLMFVG